MIAAIDHVVVLVRDIEAGVAGYRTLLGREAAWRAVRNGVATAIFTLDNISVELMAPDGAGSDAARVLAVLDRQGEGLASVAFAVGDIVSTYRRFSRLGLSPDDIVDGESCDLVSGRRLSWKRTRASSEATHGVRLFFLQRNERLEPSPAAGAASIGALDHLVISTPDPERAVALYGTRLGLDMRLDRTIPALGTRFLFFRCGDLVVEVIHRLEDVDRNGPDKIRGLSWRTTDVEAVRTRLREAGLDVSELREGRKPGTRVFTVRTGTFGVPTIVIEQGRQEAA